MYKVASYDFFIVVNVLATVSVTENESQVQVCAILSTATPITGSVPVFLSTTDGIGKSTQQ